MIRAHSPGSPANGMPASTGYVWHGDPALSEKARKAKPRKARRPGLTPYAELCRTRDIPRTCICHWHWSIGHKQWRFTQLRRGCPWHSKRRPA